MSTTQATTRSLHRAVPGHGCAVEYHVVARVDDHGGITGYSIVRRRDLYDLDPRTYERIGGPRAVEWLWLERSPYNYPTLGRAVIVANRMALETRGFWLQLVRLHKKQMASLAGALA